MYHCKNYNKNNDIKNVFRQDMVNLLPKCIGFAFMR